MAKGAISPSEQLAAARISLADLVEERGKVQDQGSKDALEHEIRATERLIRRLENIAKGSVTDGN